MHIAVWFESLSSPLPLWPYFRVIVLIVELLNAGMSQFHFRQFYAKSIRTGSAKRPSWQPAH
eukprot:scaffold490784_cov31-Prasinocladus_malaysianus.AAC.1